MGHFFEKKQKPKMTGKTPTYLWHIQTIKSCFANGIYMAPLVLDIFMTTLGGQGW